MNHFRKGLLKVERSVHFLMKWVLFLILGGMTLIVFMGVFFRYILKAPLPWSEELARYLMIWGASLGAFVAFREGSHVGVTFIMDRFRGKIGIFLKRVSQLLLTIFVAIVAKEGFGLVLKLKGQTSPAMEIPMGLAYLAIPVGFLLILLEALMMISIKDYHRIQEGEKNL